MLELLKTYSVSEIITFIILLALALKGLVTFFDWGYERLKKNFDRGFQKTKEKEGLENRLHNYDVQIEKLMKAQGTTTEKVENILGKIELLINSDKDATKSYITDKHHFYCYKQKWIDDYALDCLERRFEHYLQENGNSFVEDLMKEIRDLPRLPPNN